MSAAIACSLTPGAKRPRENRVPIMLSEAELASIDDWRFRNRIATRSDAVRRLVKLALSADAGHCREARP